MKNTKKGGKHYEKATKTRACDHWQSKHFGIVRNRAEAFLHDIARPNFEALQREKAKGKLVYTDCVYLRQIVKVKIRKRKIR